MDYQLGYNKGWLGIPPSWDDLNGAANRADWLRGWQDGLINRAKR